MGGSQNARGDNDGPAARLDPIGDRVELTRREPRKVLADEHKHVERIQADRVGRNRMQIQLDGERQEHGANRIRRAKGVEAELSRELMHRGVAESCDRKDKLPLPFERHDKIVWPRSSVPREP